MRLAGRGFSFLAVGVAVLALAGCGNGGASSTPGGASSTPGAAPTPPPAPPPPEPQTWIGFASPTRASLVEGGRVRAVVVVSGERLRLPLRLPVDGNAPAGELLVSEEVEIEAYAHGAVEIGGIRDQRSEGTASYELALREPPEGLPSGVAFAEGATTFRVTVHDAEGRAECSRLDLEVSRESFNRPGGFSTARFTVEGPPDLAVRFLEPYWDDRFEQWDEPPELPLDLSDIPPVTLAIPSSLSYQRLSSGGHRQRIPLSWYNDLEVAAVAPGCRPVSLECQARTILTRGCRP